MSTHHSGQQERPDSDVDQSGEAENKNSILFVGSKQQKDDRSSNTALPQPLNTGGNPGTDSLPDNRGLQVPIGGKSPRVSGSSMDDGNAITHFNSSEPQYKAKPQKRASLVTNEGYPQQLHPIDLNYRTQLMGELDGQDPEPSLDEEVGVNDLQSRQRRSRSCVKQCLACKHCFLKCMRYLRPPAWLTRSLMFLYRHLGAVITYTIFVLSVYATILSISPSVALPPICRRVSVPVSVNNQNQTTSTTTTTEQSSDSSSLDPGYMEALECRRGAALSVIIYYAFGFVCGELMELIHLPGLLGMLVGGLALRNIGAVALPYKIYHEGFVPNGSYPLSPVGHSFPMHTDSDSLFPMQDIKTQLAALLVVNPDLSGTLRQLALTTILTRAGLGIDPATLKAVFGSVFRLAFIPCIVEAFTLMILTRFLIGWPWAWGAILGFVCAAVSPAVIVPNMMRLEVTGWGVRQGIPTLVVAASSLDDVIAITGFGVALAVALATGKSLAVTLLHGPLEAFGGALFGAAVGSLLCLFPPPKLEHSHLIRGILLMCFAITGLMGSVHLDVAGAGALACLTLAFVVANCWRAGYPWRLTQSDIILDLEDPNNMLDTCHSPLSSDDEQNKGPLKPPVGGGTTTEKTFGPNSMGMSTPKSNRLQVTELDSDNLQKPPGDEEELGLSDYEAALKRRHHKESISSSILESLVEYHPYYCSILQKQYQNSLKRAQHQGTSNRSSMSKKGLKSMHGGDLPALAVAVAATGTERRDSGNTQSQFLLRRSRPRASRRFSLPEPTAHYEMESFRVSPAFRRDMGSGSIRSGKLKVPQSRRRILSPTFREQYAAMHNLPVDKLEEEEEFDEDHAAQKAKRSVVYSSDDDEPEKNANAFEPGPVRRESLVALPATPQERGLTCLNSMRQTLAAVWWFVQPILFTLIGAEVNLTKLAGGSTGVGVGCLVIALLVRVAATVVAVLPSNMNMKERLFVGLSWLPKATVQAAVGPVALDTARKLHSAPELIGYGELVLTIAAIAILISAPLGAILIPLTAPYLLRQDLNATQVMVAQTRRRDNTETHSKPPQASAPSIKMKTLPPLPERPGERPSATLHSNEELP